MDLKVTQEDPEFDRIVSDKRHSEILSALKTLIAESKKEKIPADNGVKGAIDNHIKSINNLLISMANLPKPPAPVVNATMDASPVAVAVSQIGSHISALKELIVDKPKEWTFTVVRNRAGLIETVTAKSK